METPKDARKQTKAINKEHREGWQTRWFGLLPLATRMVIEQTKIKKGNLLGNGSGDCLLPEYFLEGFLLYAANMAVTADKRLRNK